MHNSKNFLWRQILLVLQPLVNKKAIHKDKGSIYRPLSRVYQQAQVKRLPIAKLKGKLDCTLNLTECCCTLSVQPNMSKDWQKTVNLWRCNTPKKCPRKRGLQVIHNRSKMSTPIRTQTWRICLEQQQFGLWKRRQEEHEMGQNKMANRRPKTRQSKPYHKKE